MPQGTIKTVVIGKGFGFISRHQRPDLFFHVRHLDPSLEWCEQLKERVVEFDLQDDPQGRPEAIRIRPAH